MENRKIEKYRILHIDDDFDALKLLQMRLRGGFEVLSAGSAREALLILETQWFDVIITDYEMPETNGIQLLKIIKKRHPEIPVIFYTGQGNEEVAREAFVNGVSDYITKSRYEIAQSEKLLNSILKAVDARRFGEELKESHRRFTTLIQNVPGIVYRCKNDKDRTMEFLNDNVFELTGYHPDELINNRVLAFGKIIHPEDRERIRSKIKCAVEKRIPFNLEYRVISRKGKVKDMLEEGRGVFSKQENLLALEGVILDDTSRKKAEKNLIQVNRVLMAIRDINRLIVREKKLDGLLSGACEILVKSRGYSLAWIGLREKGATCLIPAACAGNNAGTIDEVRFNCDCNGRRICPMGTAVARGEVCYSRNIAHDSREIPWREEALKRGFRSGAFLPMKINGKTFGFLNVFSGSPFIFDVMELDLLKDLADDISLALLAIEEEAMRKKAEIALRKSEITYGSLFENANDAVFFETMNGRIIDANRKACEIYGYNKEELLSMSVRDLITPEGAKKIPQINAILERDGSLCIENRNICRSGKIIDVEASIAPVLIGNQKRVLTLIRDITSRKRTKAENEILKERFESVIENTPMVAIQGFDSTGNIIHWNRESERIYGFSKQEATGKKIQELLFDEESRGKFIGKINEALVTGKPLSPIEWESTSSDGKKYWLLSTLFPVFEGEKIAELFSVEVDITSIKAAEKALKISEERYRGIFEYMTSGMATCRMTGDCRDAIFTEWNREAEEIFGIKKQEIMGRKVTEVFPGARAFGLINAVYDVWKTGNPRFTGPKLYRDEVYEQWLEFFIYKNPSTDEVVTIFDDIHERIESEIILKENQAHLSSIIKTQKDLIFETDL